eukprot:IDg18146t1
MLMRISELQGKQETVRGILIAELGFLTPPMNCSSAFLLFPTLEMPETEYLKRLPMLPDQLNWTTRNTDACRFISSCILGVMANTNDKIPMPFVPALHAS